MDDLSVREATLKDKAEALCIHDDVFEGSDYLPVYYDHFLASPDITPFVLLQQNKIVSTNFYSYLGKSVGQKIMCISKESEKDRNL